MKRITIRKAIILLVAVSLLVTFWGIYKGNESQKIISEFGKYQGYSEETYDGSQRTSDYLTLSDGTRLAFDLIIPTQKGVPAEKPFQSFSNTLPTGEPGQFTTKREICLSANLWIGRQKLFSVSVTGWRVTRAAS